MSFQRGAAPLLECTDIVKVHRQGGQSVHALRGLSLTVARKEFACVSGRSGSGKTTLLNCIGTLDKATSGKIFLDGVSIENLSENLLLPVRRKYFGFIFQEARLFPHLSVLDNAALPLVYRGKNWKEARRIARHSVGEAELAHRADYPARLLSGGEAQRAAVARAIVYSPEILLADEPTAELDSAASRQVLDLIRRQTGHGMAVIAASHDPAVAEIAGRILKLEDGRFDLNTAGLR